MNISKCPSQYLSLYTQRRAAPALLFAVEGSSYRVSYWSKYREQMLAECSALNETSAHILGPRFREHCGRRGREIVRVWGKGKALWKVSWTWLGCCTHGPTAVAVCAGSSQLQSNTEGKGLMKSCPHWATGIWWLLGEEQFSLRVRPLVDCPRSSCWLWWLEWKWPPACRE